MFGKLELERNCFQTKTTCSHFIVKDPPQDVDDPVRATVDHTVRFKTMGCEGGGAGVTQNRHVGLPFYLRRSPERSEFRYD